MKQIKNYQDDNYVNKQAYLMWEKEWGFVFMILGASIIIVNLLLLLALVSLQ